MNMELFPREYSNNVDSYPMIPVRGFVVFPNTVCHLKIGRQLSVSAVEKSLAKDNIVFLATQYDQTVENPTPEQVYPFGALARITQHRHIEGGIIDIQIECIARATVIRVDELNGYWQATVQRITQPLDLDSRTRELADRLISLINEHSRHTNIDDGTRAFLNILIQEDDPQRVADLIAYYLNLNLEDKQELLEVLPINEQLLRIIGIIEDGSENLWVNPRPEDDPSNRMEFARWLAHKGKYEESLSEFLWCFGHGLEHHSAFYAVRLSFLLGYIGDMGKDYPPAIEALRQRRDALEQIVLEGKASYDQAADFTAINDHIGDAARTLAAYDKLRHLDHKVCEMMFRHVLDLLLENKRYGDIVDEAGNIAEIIETAIKSCEKHIEMLNAYSGKDEPDYETISYFRESVVENGGKYYESLLGIGKFDEAAQAANRLIEFETTGNTFAILIGHAIRAGANDQAREIAAQGLKSLPEEEKDSVRIAVERGKLQMN